MARDLERMREAGFNMVRMGEFAWHKFEPEENRFEFDWLDEWIGKLGDAGIATMLCTPTATPPRWLTAKYPEVLAQNEAGQTLRHGSRQHASHFSDLFREQSRKITQVLAEHYRDHPFVAGWQTDNEFHCHFAEDHGSSAQVAFREYMRECCGNDIDQLNQRWGADFWAMAYQNFDQIETPIEGRPTHLNPSQILDYQRFLDWGVTRFQREQVEILRKANPKWWITHNGCFSSIDYRGAFTRDLDFLSYDSYPFFDPDPSNRRFSHAYNLDYVRSYAGNFMIPEQQSGPGGQTTYLHDTPEPGEMRRMALASIAHGADSLLFFRWRTCRFGAEEYWCGLLDHDNRPKRRLQEAAQLGRELKRLGPELLGSSVQVDVAVAGGDFDAQAGHQALHLGLPGPRQASEEVHHVLNRRGYAVGVVHPEDALDGIQVYLIPHMPYLSQEAVSNLEKWVESGGVLVVGPRCGCKDENNHVIGDPLPGRMRALTGTTVREYGHQNNSEMRPLFISIGDQRVQTTVWYEELDPGEGVDVVGIWDSRFLSGQPAVTVNQFGKGLVLHVGAWMNEELVDALLQWLASRHRLPDVVQVPAEVEVVHRIHPDGRRLRFYINHADHDVRCAISGPVQDILTGQSITDTFCLAPQDVAVVALAK
jgi:beta-galactosidase